MTHANLVAPLRGRTVLLVEDNAINQMVATELLRDEAGMLVSVAVDGFTALRMLDNASFDIVLMDVQMPGMDGLEATRRLRADGRHGQMPIVAMTAHAQVNDRMACLAAGMNDCVIKPFDPDVLFEVLTRWLPEPTAPAPAMPDAAAMRALPAVDEAVDFTAGLRRCMGKTDLYRRIATRFVQARDLDMQRVREAWARQQTQEVADIVHQLISSAGTIGAETLSQRARALHVALMEGRHERLLDDIDVMEVLLQRVLQSLQAYLNTQP